jgi:hypothetical protein
MSVNQATIRQPSLLVVAVQDLDPNLLSWDEVAKGARVKDLPTCVLHDPASRPDEAAVLSWRWDLEAGTGRSRNVALSLKYARECGIRYLVLDLVSIDQSQPKDDLLHDVVSLANLFTSLPVIAAYDERDATMDLWSRTPRRPWILSEIRAFCQNPTSVTYVGYRHGAANRRHLSSANEVSVIRSSGYAARILEILYGRVAMTDVDDFSLILAEFTEPIAACRRAFGRSDYLFASFLLTAQYEKSQTVKAGEDYKNYGFRLDVHEPIFDKVGLQRFSVGAYHGPVRNYEFGHTLLLDGNEIAVWRSKMTSSFDRNWIAILPHAEQHIFDAIGLSSEARAAYTQRSGRRTVFLQIDKNAPTSSIRERAACLAQGRWLRELPQPEATTLGFNADLWR